MLREVAREGEIEVEVEVDPEASEEFDPEAPGEFDEKAILSVREKMILIAIGRCLGLKRGVIFNNKKPCEAFDLQGEINTTTN